MVKEPKIYFDNEAELFDCLEEWKQRLGLSDWNIAARICGKDDMVLDECAGENEVQFLHRTACISILRKEELPPDLLLKQAHEHTLIHELLHCKFVGFDPETREDAFFEMKQHQLLEDMSRALFMAKYDLPKSWFVPDQYKYQVGQT